MPDAEPTDLPADSEPTPSDTASLDAKHRQVALDLLVSGQASQDTLEQAVELVRKRRGEGAEAHLLPVLVGLGVLSAEEADQALSRIETVSNAAEIGGQNWWDSDAGKVESAEATEGKDWWDSDSGKTEPEPAAPATAESQPEAEPPSVGAGLTPARDDEGEPEAEPEGEPEAEREAEPEAEPEAEREGEPEAEPEAEREAEPEGEPEAEPEGEPEADAEAQPEADAEAQPEAKAEPEADPKTDTVPELEPVAAAAPTGSPPSSRPRRATGVSSARTRFDADGGRQGTLLAGAIGLVIVLLLAGLAMRGSSPAVVSPSPSASGTQVASEAPLQLLTVPQSLELLGRLANEGKFAQAIEALERADPALLELGKADFAGQLDMLQRGLALRAQMDAALAKGVQSRELRELVLQSENYELDPDLQKLGFVAAFQSRVRRGLGDQGYQDLVLYGIQETAAEVDEDDDEIELLRPTVVEITTRGSEERRARFAAEAVVAARRVSEARERIEAKSLATKERLKVEASRALAVREPIEVPQWRGEPAWSGRLVGYSEHAFVLKGPIGRRRFTWIDAPPATACDVMERGVGGEDAEGLYRVLRRALAGGEFERARGYYARLKEVAPDRPVPVLAELEPLGRVYQAAGTATAEALDLVYDFNDAAQAQDWLQVGPVQVASGELVLRPLTQLGLPSARAIHLGEFAEWTCTVSAAFVSSRVAVGFGQHYVRCGSDGVALGSWSEEDPDDLATESAPVDMTLPFEVAVKPTAGAIDVEVRQGEQVLLKATAPAAARGLLFVIGAEGGEARIDELHIRGRPSPEWFRRARDAIPFALEQAIEEWEQRYGPDATAMLELLPPRFAKTSAEDEVGLEGVPAAALAEVETARRWLELRSYSSAARYLRSAIGKGRGSYWAAEYLLALCELEEAAHGDNLQGERIRLEQALEGIEDFYEALAARSVLHLQEGYLRAARQDAERALELRPDYAPAHMALAWVRVQEGDLPGAVAEANLASELSGDLDTRREAAMIQALRDGPAWGEPSRLESEHYILWTDMPAPRAEGFLRDLEELRDLAPRAVPALERREGARQRKGEVFIFARPEDFYRYAHRTLGRRGEDMAGVFSPRSGKLLLFESREGPEQTSLVLRHEATHQWVHSLGLALPYWVNEAIATYLAGIREGSPGRFETVNWDEQEIEVLLREEARWTSLFELMTMSPGEFYSGYTYLNYAQAWSFVHYCMEGGDSALRGAFLAYLSRHSQGRAGDKSGLLGVKLEHIYAETFHQLDMQAVEKRWQAHVKTRLAKVLQER